MTNTAKKEPVSVTSKYDSLDALRSKLIEHERKAVKKESEVYADVFTIEDKPNGLDSHLDTLIADKRNFSKFQIMDGMVERVSEILEERGIVEFDQKKIEKDVEKWVPRVSIRKETPPEFIERVYGHIRGATMAAIQNIDGKLYQAHRNWLKRQQKTPDYPIPLKQDLGLTESPTSYQSYCYRRVMAFYNKKYA